MDTSQLGVGKLMKGIACFIASILFSISLRAQNPVRWDYSAKKIADKTYEVHIVAMIEDGWHLFSQNQPEDAIVIPTGIRFNKNPLLSFKDKVKEIGTLQKRKEPALGLESWQYSEKVTFVQTIKLKSPAKTNVTGSIEFQTCTDEKCLIPITVNFTVLLQ